MDRSSLVKLVSVMTVIGIAWLAGCMPMRMPESGMPIGLTAKQHLGMMLFNDRNMSTPAGQACTDCHGAAAGWTGPSSAVNQQGAVIEGAVAGRFGNRKPPSSAYASFSPDFHFDVALGFRGGQFWDGRAANLTEQAKAPLLNPLEQNNADAQAVCKKVSAAHYIMLYFNVFGFGSIDCANDFDTTFGRIAQAIDAFESSSQSNAFSSKYDAFLAGKVTLSSAEQLGLQLFEGKANCASCHPSQPGPNQEPPLFTHYTYANIGVPKNPANPFYAAPVAVNPDGANWQDLGLGGFLATTVEFNAMAAANMGKMKVPTLRNVDKRPSASFVKAYMHNGVFKSLIEVVHFHNTRDVLPTCSTSVGAGVACWPAPEVAQNVNKTLVGNLGLTASEEQALVAFLATLSDGFR